MFVCQLCYTQSGGGERFRKFNCCNLAYWHTYKFACNQIWKKFAPTIIAPVWHFLYPGNQFHIKPSSFPSVQYHLMLLHMSYPSLKTKVLNLLRDTPSHAPLKQVVRDLEFLFEFAIPTVSARTFAHCYVTTCYVQALDYGIMLKLDDGKLAAKQTMRMLHLLVLLCKADRSRVYVQAVLMQCLLLRYQRKRKLPVWTMFKHSFATFNEEAGEISFSMLGRSVRSDTGLDFLAHCQKYYGMLHSYARTERVTKAHHGGPESDGSYTNWRRTVETDAVRATTESVLHLLRAIRQDKYLVYPGTPASYKDKAVAQQNMIPYSMKKEAYWDINFHHALDQYSHGCRTKYKVDCRGDAWYTAFSDIWPELAVPEPDLEEVSSECSDSNYCSSVGLEPERLPSFQSCVSEDEVQLPQVSDEDDSRSISSLSSLAEDSQDQMDHKHNGDSEPQLRMEDDVQVQAGPQDEEVYNPPEQTTPMESPARDKTYLWDNDNLIVPGGRQARRNRGKLKPDANFAFVSTLNSEDTIAKKRRRGQ